MTCVCTTYIFYAPEGLRLPYNVSVIIGLITTIIFLSIFTLKKSEKLKVIMEKVRGM
jgi:hypothetical protein